MLAEITLLEAQVRALQAAKAAEEAAASVSVDVSPKEGGKEEDGKGGSWWR